MQTKFCSMVLVGHGSYLPHKIVFEELVDKKLGGRLVIKNQNATRNLDHSWLNSKSANRAIEHECGEQKHNSKFWLQNKCGTSKNIEQIKHVNLNEPRGF